MIEIIKESEIVEDVYYTREFQLIGEPIGNGFSFPVDEKTQEVILNDCSRENFEYCLAHPEKLTDRGIVKNVRRYRQPKLARCRCGEEFYLTNQYLGACECPGCGQWYSLFGQELTDPSTWRENDDW